MSKLGIYGRVFRVKQWIKNSFLFIPSFFAGEIFKSGEFPNLVIAFFCFSFVASGIYILNDIRDVEADRLHPTKKNRPFAAGLVSPGTGYILMILAWIVGLGGALYLSLDFLILSLLYLIINIAYSMGLKSVSIVDLLIVSSGFLIRIHAGGVIADVPVSHWLSIMIFLLSLFIVLAKRSDDLMIPQEERKVVRKASLRYNNEFINACLTMVSGIIIVAYILYTVSPEIVEKWGTDNIYITTIFVIAGLMRYLQLALVEHNTGSPIEVLYKDKFIIITLIAWAISFFVIIYV